MNQTQIAALISAIQTCRELKDYKASGELIRVLDSNGYEVLDVGDEIQLHKPEQQFKPDPTPTIGELINQRQDARNRKDWAEADRLRDLIQGRSGKRLVDRADGYSVLV